eukprot:11845720-Ditylum_brightwellii.AAC.1
MAFNIGQKVWAKHSGCHGYHHATIVIEIDNGESFLLRWRKNDGMTTLYHNTDIAGGVPH